MDAPSKTPLKRNPAIPGSIYRQKDRAKYTVTYPFVDPRTGRKTPRYGSALTVEAANDLLEEWHATTAEEHREQVLEPTRFRDLAADWLTEKDPRYDRRQAPDGYLFTERVVDDGTWRDYASEIATHLIPELGDLPLSAITRARVQVFLDELPHRESQMHAGQAISRSMVMKVYRRLFSIVQFGRVNGSITGDPMFGNPLPAPVRRSTRHKAEVTALDRALSQREVDRLIEWLGAAYPDHRAYAARFQLGAEAGLRQAEATGLTWNRVDLRARLLVVHQQLVHEPWQHGCGPLDRQAGVTPCTLDARSTAGDRRLGQLRAAQCPLRTGGTWWVDQDTKSHQQRRVAMTTELTALLEDLYEKRRVPTRTKAAERALNGVRARSRYPVEHADLVFTAQRGGHISKSVDNTLWHRALDGAGVPSQDRTVHALRHTAATAWIRSGLPLPTVQILLGHSSLQVLQRYYGGVHASSVEVADQLAEYIARVRSAN
ncbi:tyrosine-type recombinase/integrase [Actinotalea sp. JY-7885]|uniref:tyrosine-type recombinase/integrase n=1 Tax=Actinotalea sp. JY-7885 TaxID=2758576 RepID=UPI00165D792F|nr:tyrosine-type recombinase/integrase [Actinotalea sp. JY-7885]